MALTVRQVLTLAIGWDVKPSCPFFSCFQHISCLERFNGLLQKHKKREKACFPILFSLMAGLTDIKEDTNSAWWFPWDSSVLSVSSPCESTGDSEVRRHSKSPYKTRLPPAEGPRKKWAKEKKIVLLAEQVKTSRRFDGVFPDRPCETDPCVTAGLPTPWCAVLHALAIKEMPMTGFSTVIMGILAIEVPFPSET